MDKKIIAVALVLVLMVTAFVGCGQKYKTTELGGKDYLLETDREGNTIVRDEGIVAVVTDREGEIITYENGENQTYYVPIPGSLVIDGVVRGDNFKLNILDGWTSTDYNKIIKDKTDDKCYIQFAKIINKFEKDENLDTYLAEVDELNKKIAEGFSNEETMNNLIKDNPDLATLKGVRYTIEKSDTVLTTDSIHCKVRVHKFVDKDGKIIQYVENYYFESEGSVYRLDFACQEGVGYDETFDFKSYANENFKFVK